MIAYAAKEFSYQNSIINYCKKNCCYKLTLSKEH